jgi:hypothetical protein
MTLVAVVNSAGRWPKKAEGVTIANIRLWILLQNQLLPAFGDGFKAPAWNGLSFCALAMHGSFAGRS